ncbi:MAG: tRNA (guanosine(46)-N7)-methyltransferase TrmB [Bacteroidota bacterium]
MGKKKLARLKELSTFERVIQPPFEEVFRSDYRLKGKWSKELFKNDQPLVLELGCGKGEYTLGLARKRPWNNFMGIDIKGARIWTGAQAAQEEGLENVVFLRTRIDFITSFFAKDEVNELWITFPDPQEKLRRRKKRLTGAAFLNKYRLFLKDGGLVHLKTDNRSLYRDTLELVNYNKLQVERKSEDIYMEDWMDETVSIQTYYEKRFLAEGLPITYLSFRLPAHQEIIALPD